MKYIAVLTCLLLSSIAHPAFAVPGNDCAARSEKVKVTERDEFMKSCLAQVSAPANVKEAKQKHKSARCEQNAKNMHLQGADKGNYQADCVNKNEAVVAANTLPKNTVDLSSHTTSADKPKGKSASHKDAAKKPAAKKQKEHKKNAKKNEKQATRVAGANEAQ
jgi:hypothetical protein